MNSMASRPDVDIDSCAQEPIHIPGHIQPHGHLMAFFGPDLLLTHASAGAAGVVLPEELSRAFGQALPDIVSLEPMPEIVNGLHALPGRGMVQLGPCRSANGTFFQALAHRSPDGYAILELEFVGRDTDLDHPSTTLESLYPAVRDAFDHLVNASSIEDLASVAAAEVRRITGFDRVLVYRFDESWDGVVVAEDRNDRLPAYLGLRFPASDIPAQARRLYEVNRQRLIADASYVPVPIVAARRGPPLDLTFSSLRSVSPVHVEYMRNMGTPSSMSISLLGGGKLWGLISCHHAEPRRIPFAARGAADLIGQMLSVRIAAREDTSYAEERGRLKHIEQSLASRMAAAPSLIDGLLECPDDLLAIADATGAALIAGGRCSLIGVTPPESAVRRIAEWLAPRCAETAIDISSLASVLPDLEEFGGIASGVLAVCTMRPRPTFVLWFRPEVVGLVRWGGDPHEGTKDLHGAPSPRRSFDAWKETVRHQATPWSRASLDVAREFRATLVEAGARDEQRTAKAELERLNETLEMRVAEEVMKRAKTEEALRQAQKMEALGQLAGGIAHDFNNVLQAVDGGARLIARKSDDPETVQRLAKMVGDASARGASVVRRLLAFARRGELRAVAVDPASILTDLREVLAHTLGAAISVEVNTAPALPPILADKGQLETVLVNLATNARDAMPNGGTITLSAAEADEATVPFVRPAHAPAKAGYVKLAVTDTGTGMLPEVLARALEPFYTTKEKGKGTGLGLAMAKGFAEQSGGGLSISSSPDNGTVVTLWLPRATVGATSSDVSRQDSRQSSPTPTGVMPHALVVDDEPLVLAVLAAGLTEHGFKVSAINDAQAALDQLREGLTADILVTDLAMPGLDGLALAGRARSYRPGLPVLLLTGHVGDAGTEALAVAAGNGPFALLRKPVSPDELADRAGALLATEAA